MIINTGDYVYTKDVERNYHQYQYCTEKNDVQKARMILV